MLAMPSGFQPAQPRKHHASHGRHWHVPHLHLPKFEFVLYDEDELGTHVPPLREPARPAGGEFLCSKGHALLTYAGDGKAWKCDLCRKKPALNAIRLRCKSCDYDVCPACQSSLPLAPPAPSPLRRVDQIDSPFLALSPMPDALLTDMSPSTLTASFERAHISPGDWEQRLATPEDVSLTETHKQRDILTTRIVAAESREQQLQGDAVSLQQENAALEQRCAEMVDREAKWAKAMEREQRDLAQQLHMRCEELRQAQTAALEWQKQASALKQHVKQLQEGDALVLSEWESYSHSLSTGLEKVKADLVATQQSMQAKYDEALG